MLTGWTNSLQRNCLWLTPHSLTHLRKCSPFYVTASSSFSVTCKKIAIVPRKLKLIYTQIRSPVKAVEGKHAKAKYLGHHHTWLWQNVLVWTPTAAAGFVMYNRRAHLGVTRWLWASCSQEERTQWFWLGCLQKDIYKHCRSVVRSSRGIFSKPTVTCTRASSNKKSCQFFFFFYNAASGKV